MADKNFIVSFILKGIQDSTFYKTLQSGSGMVQAFSNQTNEMFNALGKIDPRLEKFSRSAAKVGALLGAKQLAGVGLQKSLDIFRNMKDFSGPAMDFEAAMSKVRAITGGSGLTMLQIWSIVKLSINIRDTISIIDTIKQI